MRFIIFDTETSGLGPKDGVCELAYCEIDRKGNVVEKGHSLIDPGVPISPSATGVHGIFDKDVTDSPTLEEYMTVVHEIPPFFGDEVIFIAHNARFDWKFLKDWINSETQLCTLRLARKVWPESPDHKAQTLRVYLGLPFDRGDAHSAAGDVEVVRLMLVKAMEQLDCTLDELIELSAAPIKIEVFPFGKHKGLKMADLPKQYVKWALANLDLDSDLKKALEAL